MQRRSLQLILDDLNSINAQIKKESKDMVNLLQLVVELDEDASNYAQIAAEFLEAGATSKADKYEALAVEIKKKANQLRKKLAKTQEGLEELTSVRNDRLITIAQMRGTLIK